MLTWTRQKPDTTGWYWMLSPSHHSNLPTVVQIVFDGQTRLWLALIPACQDPRQVGREVNLRHLDAVWAGPLKVPSVLSEQSPGMVYDRIDQPLITT